MSAARELAALYSRDLARLIQELQAFPNTASLWETAPGVTNAAGTLALHLEGNLREYVGRQLGGLDYTRQRPLEFSTRGTEQQELIRRLTSVRMAIPPVIATLTDAQLNAESGEQINGQTTTNRQFLFHLLGHLNYHLGQVDYQRRFATGDGAIELAAL